MFFNDFTLDVKKGPMGVSIKHVGAGSKIPKSWKVEISRFKIMTSGFCCTNLKQINSRKLLNLLFKYISIKIT